MFYCNPGKVGDILGVLVVAFSEYRVIHIIIMLLLAVELFCWGCQQTPTFFRHARMFKEIIIISNAN